MAGKIVASDVVTRRVQTYHEEGGKVVLNTAYDAEPAIDYAAATRNHLWDGTFRGTKELGMVKAAILPMTIWMHLKKTGVLDDAAAFKRWLADPDHAAFRATGGRI